MEFKVLRKKLDKKLNGSQNLIKIAYAINKTKPNFYAGQEIKASLLFETLKHSMF
jgi:hypothetical protein